MASTGLRDYASLEAGRSSELRRLLRQPGQCPAVATDEVERHVSARRRRDAHRRAARDLVRHPHDARREIVEVRVDGPWRLQHLPIDVTDEQVAQTRTLCGLARHAVVDELRCELDGQLGATHGLCDLRGRLLA